MDICYVDESGSCELLLPSAPNSSPVLVILGLIVPSGRMKDLVWDFLKVKKRFNPSLNKGQLSAVISAEMKGGNLRGDIRKGSHRQSRRAVQILDAVLELVEKHQCKVLGRVVVKDENEVLDDSIVYGSAVSWICHNFHAYLEAEPYGAGLVILDSRSQRSNTPNSDRITTKKFASGGDTLSKLAEVPVFGHSVSHVGLQIIDIIASAIAFPSACAAYCEHLDWNDHAHPAYEQIRDRFGERLEQLQWRYFDNARGYWRGGIYATGSSGPLSAALFKKRPVAGPPRSEVERLPFPPIE